MQGFGDRSGVQGRTKDGPTLWDGLNVVDHTFGRLLLLVNRV